MNSNEQKSCYVAPKNCNFGDISRGPRVELEQETVTQMAPLWIIHRGVIEEFNNRTHTCVCLWACVLREWMWTFFYG